MQAHYDVPVIEIASGYETNGFYYYLGRLLRCSLAGH